MSTKAEILELAMTLPEADRMDLAEALEASVRPSIEQAWAEEITRRAQKVRDEGSSGDEWDVVEARILDSLGLSPTDFPLLWGELPTESLDKSTEFRYFR